MADRQWYTGRGGEQEGPFSDEWLRELIATGVVVADTLVWSAGMTNWAKAAEAPGLMPRRVPSTRAVGGVGVGAASGPLSLDVGVWALFWRAVVLGLSQMAVIPLPWVAPIFSQWFVERIQVPGGRRMGFVDTAKDIWWAFILHALCSLLTIFVDQRGYLPLIGLQIFFELVILRWFVGKLTWEGQTQPLRFTGSYGALLGWNVLLGLSILSIIGWAWVAAAWGRWMCRHVQGSSRELVFTASGWSYLWRTLVAFFTGFLIIPIPWTLRWFMRWLVSQMALVERSQA
jgi:hypothetical protein